VLTIALVFSGVLVWAFGNGSQLGVWGALVGVIVLPKLWRSPSALVWRYTGFVFGGIYLLLHVFFYPKLLEYQSGISLAKAWQKDRVRNIEAPIYKLDDQYTWSMDFYTHQPLQQIDRKELESISAGWLYLDTDPSLLLKNSSRSWTLIKKSPHYRITRLNWRFIHPMTRDLQLSYRYLVWVSPVQ
jgi:hypothetical protein